MASANIVKGSVAIPFFDPEDQKISPRAWLQLIELARTSAGKEKVTVDNVEVERWRWSDQQLITNSILLMKGSSSTWAEILLEKDAPELKNWENFKALFRKRFVKALTLTEKIALTDLHQKASENVSQFLDRCINNLNLFFETQWEHLEVGSKKAEFPWGTPNTTVTEDHIKVSQNYYREAINLQVRLLFASGLRPEIKKQVLMQPAEKLDEILEVAKRVESSLKETKKEISMASIVDRDNIPNLEDLEIAAANRKFKPPSNPNQSRNPSPNSGPAPNAGQCYYCLRKGHYKRDCMTMKNDRGKGIFRSNIQAPLSRQRQAAATNIEENVEEMEAEATAAATAQVNSAQVDLNYLLNPYSV